MFISELGVPRVRRGETTNNDDPTATVWVDARTWEEAEAVLADRPWKPSERWLWVSVERQGLEALSRRLLNGATIMHAGHSCIAGLDSIGLWEFRPFYGMLHPIHLHQIMPVVKDSRQLDRVGRGVLESRLVCDGHNPHHARWAVEEGIRQLGMAWCSDEEGEALTSTLIEDGWDTVARDLATCIERHKGVLPAQWSDPNRIARFEEAIPRFAGLEKPDKFWWRRLPYYLRPTEFALVSSLWAAPDMSLSLADAVLALWNASESRAAHFEARLHTHASRANSALDGTGIMIHVKEAWDRDHLRKHVRAWIELP